VRIINPISMLGRSLVGIMGKPCGRSYWQGERILADDGAVLYSAIQRKAYQDVGRSAVCLVLSMPLMVTATYAMVVARDIPSTSALMLCLCAIAFAVFSFIGFRSDLRDSQLIHVAAEPGIADDVFDHEDEDEDEPGDDEEEDEDEDDDGDDDHETESAPDNVVNFAKDGQQKTGEAW
jgi:hypothetical protein